MQGIVHAVFLLFHLHFGRSTDVENSYAAAQLGEALLQFLLVVVRRRGFHLGLNLADAAGDGLFRALAVHDGRVVLVDDDFLGRAEVLQGRVFELVALLFADNGTAREGSNVFQHGLAAVAEAGSLHGRDFQRAAQLVHHQRSEGLAVHIFRNDDEGLASLKYLLQYGQELLHSAHFLVVDENVRRLELNLHFLGVGHEVRGEIAAVELHAFHRFHFGFGAPRFLYRDNAFLAHFLHGIGNHLADFGVVVSRNRAYLGNFCRVLNLL